jgi:hypothetical protein
MRLLIQNVYIEKHQTNAPNSVEWDFQSFQVNNRTIGMRYRQDSVI